jgi:hypothetical protein
MSSVVAGLQRNRKESAPRDREGCDANRAGWSLGHDQQRFLFDLCDSGSAGSGGGTGRVVAVVLGANCMFAGVCSLGSAHPQDPQSGSSIVTHVGGWLFFCIRCACRVSCTLLAWSRHSRRLYRCCRFEDEALDVMCRAFPCLPRSLPHAFAALYTAAIRIRDDKKDHLHILELFAGKAMICAAGAPSMSSRE